MLNTAAFFVAPDDILAAGDTFAVADSDFAHIAVADIAADIVADIVVVVGSSAVAHSTVALETAGTVAGFAGARLHPCNCGLLQPTACRNAPLFSFQPLALLQRGSLGA